MAKHTGDIDLDKHFRRDSKARKVAEALLTGKPMTRQELSSRAGGVAITTINRVVEVLEECGATIVRSIAEDGRQARFTFTQMGKPRSKNTYPSLQQEAQIIRAEWVGGNVMIDFIAGNSRYRGLLATLTRTPPLGKKATVTGVQLQAEGQADVVLSTPGQKPMQVAHVQNVTTSN